MARCMCAGVVDNPLSYLERRRLTKVADISIVPRVAYLAMGPTDLGVSFSARRFVAHFELHEETEQRMCQNRSMSGIAESVMIATLSELQAGCGPIVTMIVGRLIDQVSKCRLYLGVISVPDGHRDLATGKVLRSQFSDRYEHLLTYQKLIADHWQLITASSCSERCTACHCYDTVSRKRLGGCRIGARTALPLAACRAAEP